MKFEKRVFWINIAGIRHENSDGSSRIKYLLKLKKEDTLKLIREPDNPFDKYAIKVVYGDDFQIGYIPKDLSKLITGYLKLGIKYKIENFLIERDDIGYQLSCGIALRMGSNWD